MPALAIHPAQVAACVAAVQGARENERAEAAAPGGGNRTGCP